MRSAARIWLLTQQALREAAHLKLAWTVWAAAVGLTATAALLREFNFGTEEGRFLCDLSEGTLMLFGLVLAMALPIVLLGQRAARGAVGLSLMHGARRHEWLLARTFASWIALVWLTGVVELILAGLLWRYGHEVSVAAIAMGGGTSALRLALVACLAALMASICQGPLLAAVMTMALTLAAQLAPAVEWAGQRSRGAAHLVWRTLDWLVPNFHAVGVSGAQVTYVGAYIVLCLVFACGAFSRREL